MKELKWGGLESWKVGEILPDNERAHNTGSENKGMQNIKLFETCEILTFFEINRQ